uniref:Uncharacterized protein n=1 Tax=Lygus hesperus TaxID=30085 RepID=A0A146M8C5_LYGHE
MDDYIETQKQAALALTQGRDALRMAVTKRTRVIWAEVRRHKLSFLILRLMGSHGVFHLSAIASFYDLLQNLLNHSVYASSCFTHTHSSSPSPVAIRSCSDVEESSSGVPAVLSSLALNALTNLLISTPLHTLGMSMMLTIARLHTQSYLTKSDVHQLAVLSHALRRDVTQMLPSPLFVLLMRFAEVAFKVGRVGGTTLTTIAVATQHQLLGLLLQNLGQPHLPSPAHAFELLASILGHFAALYKSVQQGMAQLMPVLTMADLPVIECCLFSES